MVGGSDKQGAGKTSASENEKTVMEVLMSVIGLVLAAHHSLQWWGGGVISKPPPWWALVSSKGLSSRSAWSLLKGFSNGPFCLSLSPCQSLPVPVYDNVSAGTNRWAPSAQSEPIEQQDDLHYASIHISGAQYQKVPHRLAGSNVQSDGSEEVLYSMVNVQRAKAVPEWASHDIGTEKASVLWPRQFSLL